MINPDPVVVTALIDNPLNKVFNETLQAYENPKRLETFIDEVLLYARIVELVKEGCIIFEELKNPKKKPHHTNRLKSHINFLFPWLNLENRAPRKNIGNDAAVRSSLLKVGFYVNLFIGVSFSTERVTKFDPITLRSLEKYGHVLNEALKHFTGFVQDRFYDAWPDLSFKQNWAEDYKHFGSNIERKRKERKPNCFEQLPGQEAPVAQLASGQSREDVGATTDTLRKRVAKSCNESDENDHTTAQPLQKRTKVGTEARAEVLTDENIRESHRKHPRSDYGHLAASSGFFPNQERKVETSFKKCVIDVEDALSYLKRKSNSVWWTATFVRLVSKQFSCLVFFPGDEAELREIPTKGILILQKFYTWANKATDIPWRDIPNEAPKVSKDSRQSLELVTGTVGSNIAYAGLAFMPGDIVDVRLILYHDMTMSEALDQLPEIPTPI